MSENKTEEKILLPHHEQQELCTTRLPYRQGRKLTAVKVYTICNESKHLLIFGVPSLDLRQEAKALFQKFGKLQLFVISKDHPAEQFTNTYHAVYERIQSARLAKRMLDTKNFYGGSLHVCYAPELERINETREKLLQRQKDVLNRLRNLDKETKVQKPAVLPVIDSHVPESTGSSQKINMGDFNEINFENTEIKTKRKVFGEPVAKKFKPCFIENEVQEPDEIQIPVKDSNNKPESRINFDDKIDIVDFTSVERETLTNINESLNYSNFGNEIVKKLPTKPMNKIKFSVDNKKL